MGFVQPSAMLGIHNGEMEAKHAESVVGAGRFAELCRVEFAVEFAVLCRVQAALLEVLCCFHSHVPNPVRDFAVRVPAREVPPGHNVRNGLTPNLVFRRLEEIANLIYRHGLVEKFEKYSRKAVKIHGLAEEWEVHSKKVFGVVKSLHLGRRRKVQVVAGSVFVKIGDIERINGRDIIPLRFRV